MPYTLVGAFRDASQKLTSTVFERRAGDQQQHFYDYAVTVPPDMVVIGGGGEATNVPNGALLTASYPNEELSEWRVSSKDHMFANPHNLRAYAIGLKIEGMTRDQILSQHLVRVFRATSDFEHHPQVYAAVEGDYVLIGGGFNVNWRDFNPNGGNLATASFPSNSFAWTSRSKDHGVPSKAVLTSYAIGIRRNTPVGRIDVNIAQVTSGSASHPTSTAAVADGFAISGVGAEARWQSQGQLLWKLRPTAEAAYQDVHAASKDHGFAEPGTITAYAIGIKVVP